jgi:hypothetical protein
MRPTRFLEPEFVRSEQSNNSCTTQSRSKSVKVCIMQQGERWPIQNLLSALEPFFDDHV